MLYIRDWSLVTGAEMGYYIDDNGLIKGTCSYCTVVVVVEVQPEQ